MPLHVQGAAASAPPTAAPRVLVNPREGAADDDERLPVASMQTRKAFYDNQDITHTFVDKVRGWGAAAMTLHGRTRAQRYSRRADWDHITRCAKISAPTGLQLIGNGDVYSYEDYRQPMEVRRTIMPLKPIGADDADVIGGFGAFAAAAAGDGVGGGAVMKNDDGDGDDDDEEEEEDGDDGGDDDGDDDDDGE